MEVGRYRVVVLPDDHEETADLKDAIDNDGGCLTDSRVS